MLLLIALHVALLLGVAHVMRLQQESKPPIAVPRLVYKTVPVTQHHTNVITVTSTNTFQWTQLESEDYPTYIRRLRAIGCPEETIRDIVIADVQKLMSPRFMELRRHHGPREYWKPEERELEDPLAYIESAGKRLDIDFQIRDILHALLGIDLVAERADASGEEDRYGQRLDFLPTDLRVEVRKVLERHNRTEAALRERAWAENASLTAEDEAALRQLQQRREAEVKALLSPEDFRRYELQLSPTAYAVRDSFFGMEPTEQEYLAVFDIQKDFSRKHPDDTVANPAAEAELQLKLQTALGRERYQEYLRAQDEDFRAMSVAAVRNGLPRERASQCYAVKQATLDAIRQLQSTADIPESQRQAVIQSIAAEARQTMTILMGEKALNHFIRTSQPDWLSP